jgi:diguanylate cyclase (GGDEF)-like protein
MSVRSAPRRMSDALYGARLRGTLGLAAISATVGGLLMAMPPWRGELSLPASDSIGEGIGTMLVLMLAMAVAAALLLFLRCRKLGTLLAERLDAERRSRDLASEDVLTGLGNRRGLSERLDAITCSVPAGEASEVRFALLLLDLDRFKAVNDLHGHGAGDRLLCAVAQRLRACVRGLERNVFRLGGDEFAVLIESEDALGDAPQRVAQRIVDAMAAPFADGPLRHHIGCSVGIARFPLHGEDSQTLMRRADVALYRAKGEGRSCARMFDPAMDAAIQRKAALEVAVRAALQRGDFHPNYQPIVCLESGAITGFHMLARWRPAVPGGAAARRGSGAKPDAQATDAEAGGGTADDGLERDLLPDPDSDGYGPAAFIRVAEECGLIGPLMLGLVERACRDAQQWGDAVVLAVTPSPYQFRDPAFASVLLGVLDTNAFPPRRLAVKVSEAAIVPCRRTASVVLAELRARGVTVELDGFGTGQLSLMDLAVLPLDRIKLDRSFIQALGTDPEAVAVARAIDSLARGLGRVLTADGVETPQVAATLRDIGCAIGQGWHFGRPMGSREAAELVAAGAAPAQPSVRMAAGAVQVAS